MASKGEGKLDNTPEGHTSKKAAKEAAKAAKAEAKKAAKAKARPHKEPKAPQPVPDAGWATLNLIIGLFALGLLGIWWYDATLVPIQPGNLLAGLLVLIGFSAAMQGYANRRAAKANQALELTRSQENAASFQSLQSAIEQAAAQIREEIAAIDGDLKSRQGKLTQRFDSMEEWVEQHAVPIVQNPSTIVGPLVEAREKSWDNKLDAIRKDIRDVEGKIPHVPKHDGLRERLDQMEADLIAWRNAQDQKFAAWEEREAAPAPAPAPTPAAPAPPAPEPVQPPTSHLDIESAIHRALQQHLGPAPWDPHRRWDDRASAPVPQAPAAAPVPTPIAPARPAPTPEPEPAAEPENKPKAKPKAKKGSKSRSKEGSKPKAEAKEGSKPKAEERSKPKAEAEKGSKSDAEERSKPKAEAEKGSKSDAEEGSKAEAPSKAEEAPASQASSEPLHPDAPTSSKAVQERIEQARSMVQRRRKHTKLR